MSALAARRWLFVAAPILAGVLATVGAIADPAPAEEGRELVEAYAADPGRVQVKSVAYHFAYAMWVPMVFGLVLLVRGRGGWLANLAGVLGILGVTTMPGFVIVDLFDSAAGQTIGIDATVAAGDEVEEMWALPVLAGTGVLGFILSLPVAAAAAWRAALVPWWAPVAVVAGLAAFAISGPTWPGTVVMTLAFAVFALALARMDRIGVSG